MAVWTEILDERFGVTHVEGHQVLFPIGDVSSDEAQRAIEFVEQRTVLKEMKKQFKQDAAELQMKIESRARARDRLEAAGYDKELIPL